MINYKHYIVETLIVNQFSPASCTCDKPRYNFCMMKQLLQNLRNGETQIAEVPVPTPQPGEVLVRTATSLVSAGTERMLVEFAEKNLVGKARSRPDLVRQVLEKARREGLLTTLEAAFNRLDQPMPLGYSSAGTVVELGEGVSEFHVGQRVACAGGGYAVHAEYVTVPVNLATTLPDTIEFEPAAFTTLGAIALHGFRLAETQISERVAVIGLGLLGLLVVGIARAAGCTVLGIDLDARRVALAEQMGAQAVLRPLAGEVARSFSRGRGCDAVLICADTPSTDPIELAGAIARDRARVIAIGAVGLQVPRKIYYEKELTLINSRSYGPGRYDPTYEEAGVDYPAGYVRWTEGRNLEAFVELLGSGKVDVRPLITHRFPIDQAPAAYELITGKRSEPFLGVLLTYPDSSSIPQKANSEPFPFPASKGSGVESTSPLTVRLGVLGAGNFATAVLLPALDKLPGLEKVGIVSASGASASHAARRFGFSYSAGTPTRLFSDVNINTIAILTRHHLHARQVVEALEAGKHVFCEKPLALDEKDLADIFETLRNPARRLPCSNAGMAEQPLLMVGFNRRFAPLAQHMAHFLADCQEPLAITYRVNAGYIPPTHWVHDPAQGGGRLLGEACHFIDFLTFLVGAPPVQVSAQALPDHGIYREDNVVLTFHFPGGSVGTIAYLANGDRSFSKERVEVFGGGRVAVLDDFRSLETIHEGRRQVLRSRFRQDKGYRGEWQAFINAISTAGSPPIPYDHLVGVTSASFAALQALRTGSFVQIPALEA